MMEARKHIVDWKMIVTTAGASCVGAVAGTLAVAYLPGATMERPVDAKMFEMSVGILREAVRVDDDPIRTWAVKVVEKKSGVAFSDQQRTALLKRATVESAPAPQRVR
jgi:hypothetical protein